MLDARNTLQPQPNGNLVNPWRDSNIPFGTQTNGSAKPGNSSPQSSSSSTSSSPSPSGKSGLRSRRAGSHRRISTVDGSLSFHPLQSPSKHARSPTLDGAVTRPALNRRLDSESDFDDFDQSAFGGDVGEYGQQTDREPEIMVIVHEVMRADSIAGIALKYGISLSDLRRANHLWASDSIHLRKVLYIPLHSSSRKDFFYPTNEHGETEMLNGNASIEASSSSRTSVVVQRVPLSQLAFFPPPSQSSLRLSDSDRKALPISPSPARVQSETSTSTTLSNLLLSLPLPSRDTLFPRLSSDSTETASSTNASDTSSDQAHEMDLLGRSRARKRTLSGAPSSGSDAYMHSTASLETLRTQKADFYNTPMVPLQTEQLKPSARMELPRALQRDEG